MLGNFSLSRTGITAMARCATASTARRSLPIASKQSAVSYLLEKPQHSQNGRTVSHF
ncbi:MAG: hypothetical protein HC767_01350 [Akkermansiaceae bacterium]|nr:hypothetical protein [Akkermansiaceae bacterium]